MISQMGFPHPQMLPLARALPLPYCLPYLILRSYAIDRSLTGNVLYPHLETYINTSVPRRGVPFHQREVPAPRPYVTN
jgi:hypothetical protein